mgnify:CR=1 FL=1
MFFKFIKGDYLVIKNGKYLSKLLSVFQNRTISKKKDSLINLNNDLKYRRESGIVFDNFTDRLKSRISSNYYQIILSSSGLIKSSYFDKLLWAEKKVESLKSHNINVDNNDVLLSRAAYFSLKNKGMLTFGSIPLYSTFFYINKSIVWIFLELYRTFRQSIKRLFFANNLVQSTDIMVVVSQHYQYVRLESLINTLIKDKEMSIAIITPYEVAKAHQIQSTKIQYLHINRFRSFEALIQTYSLIINYWKDLKYVKNINIMFENLKVLEALSIESFVKWHYDHINTHARTEILAKKILLDSNPSMIYSIDGSDFWVRVFEKLAHEKDVPTYCLPFGFLDENEQNWTRRSESRYGAINKGSSQLLKELTGSKYDVDIIGDPFYDNFHCNEAQIKELKNKIGVNDGDKIIAFSSFPTTSNKIGYTEGQYLQDEHELMLQKVIEISINNGYHVIVKPHPVDNNKINSIVNNFVKKDKIHIVNDMNSLEMISISDLVIGVHSKVAFEVILLNKKYLLLQWNELPDMMKLIQYNVCQISYNVNDIENKLKKSLLVPINNNYIHNRERYIHEMYVYPYEESQNRLLKVFNSIMKSKSQ